MKLAVDVSGMEELQAALRDFSDRRLRAGLATALTRTARALGQEWRSELVAKLDRPTSYTLRSVRTEGAKADKLEALVFIQSDGGKPGATVPAEYLGTQEAGGGRLQRKFERALQSQGSMPAGMFVVPGKHAQLDSFGNISRGQIVQVLAQLGAAYSPGYQRVLSKSAAKRAATAIKRGRSFVAVLEQSGRLGPGVYQVQGDALLPVFFYQRRASYRKRLDLMGKAKQMGPQVLTQELRRALSEQMQRLASKRAGGAS